MLTAVIIEDEKKYLSAFRSLLKTHCPGIHVLGDAGDIKSSHELIAGMNPDIAFLDIQLSDGTSFELLKLIEDDRKENKLNNLRIIFTTAYNHFALQAFRFSAVDYLLKPIVPDELIEAVKKAERITKINGSGSSKYSVLLDNMSKPDPEKKICLTTLDEVRIFPVKDITRCEAAHNYTTFYFTNDKPLLISKTMKEYEDLLKDYGFERIHQSHLINLKYIKAFVKKDGGSVRMNDGKEIPIARRKKEQLIEKLNQM